MSIICTCGHASGPMCNGANGCPFNAADGLPGPKIKTWAERLAEEQAKQQELLSKECKCKQPNYNPVGRCLTCGDFQPAGIFPVTQLPAEVLEAIELKAEHEAALQFHPVYSPDQNTACRICYRNGAKEYATKLHHANNEIEDKDNEIARLRTIVSKHKSGRTYQEQKSAIGHMRYLLEKVIYRHEGGLLPDRFIYNEIKTFLDGTV